MSTQTVDTTSQDDDVARAASRTRLERLALKRIVPLVLRFSDAFTESAREWSARERELCEQRTRGGPGVEPPPVKLLPPDADLLDNYATVAAINDYFCGRTRRGKRVGPLLDSSPLRLIAVADGPRGWRTRAPERVAFPADIPTIQTAMAFGIVCNEVARMVDAPSKENLGDIETALDAVEANLATADGVSPTKERRPGSESPMASFEAIETELLALLASRPPGREYVEAHPDEPVILDYVDRAEDGTTTVVRKVIEGSSQRCLAQLTARTRPRCGGVPEADLPRLVEQRLFERGLSGDIDDIEAVIRDMTAARKIERIEAGPTTSYRDLMGRKRQEVVLRYPIATDQIGGDKSAPDSPAAEDGLLKRKEAAELYARLTDTQPDESRTRKEMRDESGNYTIASVMRRAKPIIDKRPLKRRGRYTCPECNQAMPKRFGARKLCRDCYVEQLNLPD